MTSTLQQCQQQAAEIATDLRIGYNVKAQRVLPTLIEQLIQCFPRQDLNLIQRLRLIVQGVRECQEQHDWLGLADYLEYELQELLQLYL
ncbi:hypothetical protein QE250_14085 [Chromatiaceae bacterium AAb-1]|nr:hypothetical protein [Chromatiaceae bacterium AAb-1]